MWFIISPTEKFSNCEKYVNWNYKHLANLAEITHHKLSNWRQNEVRKEATCKMECT